MKLLVNILKTVSTSSKEQSLQNTLHDCSSILGKAHFTNDDTFENMNFTSAKIVACSSLKATENNRNYTTLMTKKRKLKEVNLQDHIYTCKYLVEQYIII